MSSVGQAAGAVIGGVVGFVGSGGNPLGALQGASYGAAIGGALDPADVPGYDGPRLSDTTESTSGFGVGIYDCDGKIRVPGHVFWIENNRRKEVVRKEESSGGKGGGGGQETTTYEYFGTFAVMLTDHQIQTVNRIWDSRGLLVNNGSADNGTALASGELFPLAHLYGPDTVDQLKAALAKTPTVGPKGQIRLYPGFDDQLPDPRMEADLGVNKTPAMRGRAYLVFYDFPLPNELGQSIAGVQPSAEVVVNGTQGDPVLLNQITIPNPTGFIDPWCQFLTPDLTRLYYGTERTSGAQPAYAAVSVGPFGAEPDNVNLPQSVWTNYGLWARGTTDVDIGPMGTDGSGSNISRFPGGVHLSYATTRMVRRGAEGAGVWFAWRNSTDPDQLYVGFEETGTFDQRDLIRNSPRGITMNDDGNCLVISNDWIDEYDQELQHLRSIDISGSIMPLTPLNDLPEETSYFDFDNGLLYWGRSGGSIPGTIFAFDLETETIGPAMPLAGVGFSPFAAKSNFNVSGSILTRFASQNESLGYAVVEHWKLPTPDSDGDALAAVVRRRLERSELILPGDIDVTDLAGITVRGYKTRGVSTIRGQIEPLMLGYHFDLIQDGYKIKAVLRGGSSVATIPAEDLGARPFGSAAIPALSSSREMDSQLPYKVVVKHLDAARDYEINEQYSQPRAGSKSANTQTVDLPIVMTPDEAAGVAETIWSRRWLERNVFTVKLPPTYRNIQATDVITVNTTPASYEFMLRRVSYNLDGILEIEAVSNDSAIYTPNAVGSGGVASDGTVSFGGNSKTYLLDIPLIQDAFDKPGFVGAMSGYSDSWPGGVIIRSQDGGQTFDAIQGFSGEVISGVVETPLAADDGFKIDRTNTITVRTNNPEASISSITEAQMLTFKNFAAYGADGRWEIMQFASVTDNGDGTLTLGTLVRGAKGTEWATGLHEAYDSFVFISDADAAFINSTTGEIGVSTLFKGATTGQDIDTVGDLTFSYDAENLTPLSVVNPVGTFTSGTLSIDAVRRTRLDNSMWWSIGTVAPVGETSESYEIDIMDGATVVRTLTGTSFPIEYSAADQTTDFGQPESPITCNIYQMSSVVGRGRVRNAVFNDPAKNILSPDNTDLIAYWDVADITGANMVDGSGNGYDGTITGATVVGDALVFDGTSDYVRLPSGIEVALPVTLTMNIEMDSLASDQKIFQSSDMADESSTFSGFDFEIFANGKLQAAYGDGGPSGSFTNVRGKDTATDIITTGVDYKIIMEIVGPTDITLTVDNVDVGGSYFGSGGALVNSATYDGKIGGITTGAFVGKMKGTTRLFNRALTASEKTQLFNEA